MQTFVMHHPFTPTIIKNRTIQIGVLVALLALLGSFSWVGYCWGGWLAGSAVAQRLVQCSCPTQSESQRYQPFIVIASACRKPIFVNVSQNGQWMLYREQISNGNIVLVNVETRQKRPLALDSSTTGELHFLSSTLLLVPIRDSAKIQKYMLYDTITDRAYPINKIDSWGKLLSDELLTDIKQAKLIYMTERTIVIFFGISGEQLERNLVVNAEDGVWLSELQKQLDNQAIPYVLYPFAEQFLSVGSPILSLNGTLQATRKGIYNQQTKVLVTPIRRDLQELEPPWDPLLWINQDRTVLYTRSPTTVANLGMFAYFAEEILVVPQPLLLLEVET
jgi:hypothetical protein